MSSEKDSHAGRVTSRGETMVTPEGTHGLPESVIRFPTEPFSALVSFVLQCDDLAFQDEFFPKSSEHRFCCFCTTGMAAFLKQPGRPTRAQVPCACLAQGRSCGPEI